jgi:putative copper resistance protein D
MAVYRAQCADCHGPTGAGGPGVGDLRGPAIARRHAGELFWLVTHGAPARGMPAFEGRLTETQRWDVINFIRALGAAEGARGLGREVQPDNAWLVPADFTVAVGPLAPGALRDHRGRRMVLVVLYTLPESRARMSELARGYGLLFVLGVEVIAVPMHAPADALGELGESPPILFPIVTDGAAEIATTYRMFAPGSHAELLIDRQGYLRARWIPRELGHDTEGWEDLGRLLAEVDRLSREVPVAPLAAEHVH